MNKFTKLSLVLSFVVSSFLLKAQVTDQSATKADTASFPYWIEMMQDQNANFYATQKAFNTYWEGREITRGSGYKPFKRWEYIMSQRVKPDGTRPAADRDLRALEAAIAANPNRSAEGDWTPLGPFNVPSGYNGYRGIGRISAIAFHPTDPNKIYIGAPAGGLWKSDDHGLTWTSTTDVLPTLGVSSIVVDHENPDVIFMGTGDRDAGDAAGLGVWKSTDNGLTWQPSNTGLENSTIGRLIMHPTDHNLIYAATSGGVYKTTDNGNTWTKKVNGNFKDIVFKPGNTDVIYAISGGNFFKSTDAGESFVQGAAGLPSGNRAVVAVSPANPEIVYVFLTNSDSFKGLYRSEDSGNSFTERSTSPNIMSWDCNGGDGGQAWYDLDMAVDPANADIIYGGGVNCFKSDNGGLSWYIRSHWYGGCNVQSVHADLHILEYSPLTGRLFAGNDGGVYWSGNGGENWTEISNGLVISQAYKIGQSATNRNYVINGYQDNGTSTWTGTDWIAVGGGDGMECAFDPTDDRYSYSTVYYGAINRIFNHSSQGQIAGEGSNGITESGAWVTPFLIDHNDGNIMFIGYKNIWRSTNIKANNTSSVSWTKISSINTSNLSVLAQSRANTDILYASAGNKLYRADNVKEADVNWIVLTSNLPSGNAITAIETSPFDENTVFIVQQNKVFKSEDKGFSWTNMTGNLPDVQMNTLAYYKFSPEGLYLGTDIGVFYRDSSMDDWMLFSNGLPASSKVTELEIYYDPAGQQGDVIRAGTYGRGLWESPLHFTTPAADFIADKTIVPIGCPVNFTDKSTGIPYSWEWTFEGAETATSNLQNPGGIVWNAPGEYSVSLTAINPAGNDTETKSAYIVVSSTLLPEVAFETDKRIFCTGEATVQFTDNSDFCPNSWLWSFSPDDVTYLDGTSATSQNPVVSFNGSGNYDVTLMASNVNGSSSLTLENYIQLSGALLPFGEDWESASLSANGWEVVNPDNKKTWELSPVQGTAPGNTAIKMDFFNYNVAPGPRDQLISPPFNLIGYNSAFLSFQHSYTRRYEQITDSLIVLLSDDCGASWTRVFATGEDGSGNFETHPVSITSFTPASADDWCGAPGNPDCISIDISDWVNKSDVKIMFESVHRRGNSLFLDNIAVTENSLVGADLQPVSENGIRIYPNPGNGTFVIASNEWLSGAHIQLLAADGRLMLESRLSAGKQWTVNKSDLARGIYILRINTNNQSKQLKLIVE
ncbi:MAG: PKD domain-containing protein [Lentimicrobiaceae bacterium]|nr:PKD domain-containing protein [Lentimicrobiaceae bacterium]MCO5266332.1 PKD domain-containing protein [Lentimicrobium sp.]